jgi:hypothetical protein
MEAFFHRVIIFTPKQKLFNETIRAKVSGIANGEVI